MTFSKVTRLWEAIGGDTPPHFEQPRLQAIADQRLASNFQTLFHAADAPAIFGPGAWHTPKMAAEKGSGLVSYKSVCSIRAEFGKSDQSAS